MRLFKYLHPDRTDVLRSCSIRFSSAQVLNDPFELKPHLALSPPSVRESEFDKWLQNIEDWYPKLPQECRDVVPDVEALKARLQGKRDLYVPRMEEVETKYLRMAREEFSTLTQEDIGILCLSESATNLLMWAHYADAHRGFVLEFDSTSAFFDQRLTPRAVYRYIRKVEYQDERPSTTLRDTEFNLNTLYLRKGRDWSYEAEWRMVLMLSQACEVIGEGPAAVHLFRFPCASVRKVIIGARMVPAKKTAIRELIANNRDYAHVECVEAQISDTHYRVEFSIGDRGN